MRSDPRRHRETLRSTSLPITGAGCQDSVRVLSPRDPQTPTIAATSILAWGDPLQVWRPATEPIWLHDERHSLASKPTILSDGRPFPAEGPTTNGGWGGFRGRRVQITAGEDTERGLLVCSERRKGDGFQPMPAGNQNQRYKRWMSQTFWFLWNAISQFQQKLARLLSKSSCPYVCRSLKKDASRALLWLPESIKWPNAQSVNCGLISHSFSTEQVCMSKSLWGKCLLVPTDKPNLLSPSNTDFWNVPNRKKRAGPRNGRIMQWIFYTSSSAACTLVGFKKKT